MQSNGFTIFSLSQPATRFKIVNASAFVSFDDGPLGPSLILKVLGGDDPVPRDSTCHLDSHWHHLYTSLFLEFVRKGHILATMLRYDSSISILVY
jgi:hypothetical protein